MIPENLNKFDWIKYNSYFALEHFVERVTTKKRFKSLFFKKIDGKLKSKYKKLEKKDVPVIDGEINLKTFQKIANRPILFKGSAFNWLCCQKWNFDYFKENYGNTNVTINDNKGLIDENNPQEFEALKLKEYIDALKSGTLKYLKFDRNIINQNPELKDDLNLSWLRKLWFPNSFREEMVLFMSGKKTLTPIHGAPSSNFFVQIQGNKVWTMYPPEDRLFLDVKSNRSYYYYSEADPDNPDDENFPLQKYATKYQVTLEKGDILWVPPFTWHHVYNPVPSIGLSYRYMCPKVAFKNSKFLMLLIFFANKPSIFKHFYMSAFQKQTAIFTKSEKEL